MFLLGCEGDFSAFWWPSVEIYGHMHLPQITFPLPSKSKHTVLHSWSEEWICLFFHVGVTGSLISAFLLASVWNENPWPDGRAPLSRHQQGNRQEMKVWLMHSSHLPNLISAIKTCLLQHIFLLPNTWKIYEYCIAFHIFILNPMNTQVIFLVITDESSGNLQLSSLALFLTVSALSSFYAS